MIFLVFRLLLLVLRPPPPTEPSPALSYLLAKGKSIRDEVTGKRACLYRFYHTASVRAAAFNSEGEEKALEFVEQTFKKHNCNPIVPHTINNNMLLSSHTQPILILLFLP